MECNHELVATRHPAVQEKMRWLMSYDHLAAGNIRQTSARVCILAIGMLNTLCDGPQLTIGLQRLVDAKDALVRQAIVDGEAATQGESAARGHSDTSSGTRED
jgi:hypothetical protein